MEGQIILTFFEGQDGKVIARTNEGKICLLDISYFRASHIIVKAGEEWRCIVSIDKENVNIVQPVNRTITAEDNEKLFEIKARDLRDKYARK